MATTGPFRLFLTSVAAHQNLVSGKRQASCGFVLIAEPKLTGLQVMAPRLVYSIDNHGTIHDSEGKEGRRLGFWRNPGSSVVEFTGAWVQVKIPMVETSTNLTKLSVEVPLRSVLERGECRIDKLARRSEERASEVGGRTFVLKSLDWDRKSIQAKVSVKGAKSDEFEGEAVYRFVFESGDGVTTLFARSASFFESETVLDLEGLFPSGLADDAVASLTVTFPLKTVEKKVRFDFENVRLP
ncbi:MAG: hypothetical protein ACYTFG_14960 [Planctomycetota bacterium]